MIHLYLLYHNSLELRNCYSNNNLLILNLLCCNQYLIYQSRVLLFLILFWLTPAPNRNHHYFRRKYNIIISEDAKHYLLKFFVIMSFGASIKKNCTEVLDNLEKQIRTMFPDKGCKIILKIVGVKSKNIAKRNIEIVREYEI